MKYDIYSGTGWYNAPKDILTTYWNGPGKKQTKLKKYLKKYIYIYCGILSLLSLKKYYVKAEYDEGKIESSNIYLFNIMIQPYEGGGIKFSDTANGQDGFLHVMVMNDMNFRTFVYNYCLLYTS